MRRVTIDDVEYAIDTLTWGEKNAILDEACELTENNRMRTKSGTLRHYTVLIGVKKPKLESQVRRKYGLVIREVYLKNKRLSNETLNQLYDEIEKEQFRPLESSPKQSSSTKASRTPEKTR